MTRFLALSLVTKGRNQFFSQTRLEKWWRRGGTSRISSVANTLRSLWWRSSSWVSLPLSPALPSAAPRPCPPARGRKPRAWSPGAPPSSGWWRTASCWCHGHCWPWTGFRGPCALRQSSRLQTCCRRLTCLRFRRCWWCRRPEGTSSNVGFRIIALEEKKNTTILYPLKWSNQHGHATERNKRWWKMRHFRGVNQSHVPKLSRGIQGTLNIGILRPSGTKQA